MDFQSFLKSRGGLLYSSCFTSSFNNMITLTLEKPVKLSKSHFQDIEELFDEYRKIVLENNSSSSKKEQSLASYLKTPAKQKKSKIVEGKDFLKVMRSR